jgi:TonB family protein
MKLPPVSRMALKVLLFLAVFSAPLAAQNLLLTDYKGKLLPVVRARDNRPFVEVDGKQVAAEGRRFALHKVDEYWPVFISVRDLDVSTHYMEVNGSNMNHEFHLHGRLETPYAIEDVFMVLELDTESAGKMIFLTEVGKLSPREPKYLSIQVPMASALGSGQYQIHLFTKGVEVLHSNLDSMYRESVVDRMTEKRIATVKEAAPKMFFGPQPEYPPALLKAKTSGQVVVSIRIGANGRVYDPVVKKASAPAFGEAAIAAVRLWRFLPKVKDGHPVETHADLPLDFAPPEDTKKS